MSLVTDHFTIEQDGILGVEYLRAENCVLTFSENSMRLEREQVTRYHFTQPEGNMPLREKKEIIKDKDSESY